MADVAAVRITNIVSVTQGTSKYIGVRSVTINADKGRLQAILVEGNLYASGVENLGMPDFPVSTQVTFEQDGGNCLALIGEAKASLVIVYKQAGGGANKTLTIVNHQFKNFSHPQSLQDFGKPSVSGVAHSADGAALPIAYT